MSLRNRQDRNYADRPPPTPSPNSVEFHEYQQQQQQLLPEVYASSQFLSVPMDDVPSYDETISSTNVQRTNSSTSLNIETHSRRQSNSHIPTISVDQTNNDSAPAPTTLKTLGLNFLNAKQHIALTFCRDLVLLPPLYHCILSFKKALGGSNLFNPSNMIQKLIVPGSPEHFIVGIWCIVAGYLSFAVVDGLMVRWIVTYQASAVIVRVLSMSLLLITIEQSALAIFSPDGLYSLHTWVIISCILTGAYIIQNFVTSNLYKKKARSVDYYNITVYAVVPVGLASFVSMIALLRALLIMRVDLDQREFGLV